MTQFEFQDKFVNRHIGPNNEKIEQMLSVIGISSLDKLINKTVPDSIRLKKKLKLDDPLTENEFPLLTELYKVLNNKYQISNFINAVLES